MVNKCVYCFTHFLNIIHLIIGLIFIIFGVIIFCTIDPIIMVSFDSTKVGGILIAGGCLLAIWALCGSFGMRTKNKTFMIMYIFSAILLVIIDLTIIIICLIQFISFFSMDSYIAYILKAPFEEYKGTGLLTDCLEKGLCFHIVDQVQHDFQCCGLTKDYYKTDDGRTIVPGSCCSTEAPHPCEGDDVYTEPCAPKMHSRHLGVLVWLIIGFCIALCVHLFLLIVMYYLLNSYDEDFYLEYNMCTANMIQ